ncbi:MAG TPA: PilZ domain-containing protein [Terriglobales bacterium]|nr:PilZ domain-containing protein [Terriglobales bacterium]
MEKRPETRVPADIPVRIWGMDADGKPFFQSALAGSLSNDGAQLTNLHHCLKIGDIIGIQYAEKKARFKVVWSNPSSIPRTNKAGVQILPDQTTPWGDITKENKRKLVKVGSEKRRFIRHKVNFPMVISFEDTRRPHMQCSATDIGGRGCYVETFSPLSIETDIIITFWLDSDKIKTSAVVRTSDPGVGMGIEFTALENDIQLRLQEYLEKIDKGFSKAATEGA